MGVSSNQMLPSPGAKTNLPFTPGGSTAEPPFGIGVKGDGGIGVGTGPEGIGAAVGEGKRVGVGEAAQAAKSKLKTTANPKRLIAKRPFLRVEIPINSATTNP